MEKGTIKTSFPKYAVYKDSGVEWLGEIPKHWNSIRFKFISKTQKGKLPKKISSQKIENSPPYMSMEYLRGGEENQWVLDKNAKIIHSNEILLLWDGSNAGEFIQSRQGVISSTVAHIVFKNINKDFAWYYSKKLEIELKNKTIGMGIPHVNGDYLKNLIVVLPPLHEQTAIANFLDDKTTKIDQAIAQKEKMIDLLKERKQIIVQNAVTKGLDPNVKMKDSGAEWIGEIPEHWEVVANRILFSERKEPGRDELPLLSVSIHSAVSSEELSEEDNIRGLIKIQDKSNYKYVAVGDIVFNMMRAWQGAIGAVRVEGMVSPAYIVAQSNDKINTSFFEFQYRTDSFIQQMSRNSKGITDFRKRLYWDEFKQLQTVLPPIEEQNEISNFIDVQSEKISKTINLQQSQIQKLKEYKATLIDSAVMGKIKVS